jgi:hypothetical protein
MDVPPVLFDAASRDDSVGRGGGDVGDKDDGKDGDDDEAARS